MCEAPRDGPTDSRIDSTIVDPISFHLSEVLRHLGDPDSVAAADLGQAGAFADRLPGALALAWAMRRETDDEPAEATAEPDEATRLQNQQEDARYAGLAVSTDVVPRIEDVPVGDAVDLLPPGASLARPKAAERLVRNLTYVGLGLVIRSRMPARPVTDWRLWRPERHTKNLLASGEVVRRLLAAPLPVNADTLPQRLPQSRGAVPPELCRRLLLVATFADKGGALLTTAMDAVVGVQYPEQGNDARAPFCSMPRELRSLRDEDRGLLPPHVARLAAHC